MKHILETLPDKALKTEAMAEDFLTQFFHEHAFYSLMAVMFLLIAFLIYFLIVVSRHHAEHGTAASSVRSGVVFHIGQNRQTESDTFNPIPPSRGYDDDFDD